MEEMLHDIIHLIADMIKCDEDFHKKICKIVDDYVKTKNNKTKTEDSGGNTYTESSG